MGVADRQSEAFISPERRQATFEANLLNNILFESAALLPDVFFFVSGGLASHVIRRGHGNATTLLEAGIAAGIVIPSFRNSAADDFQLAYDIVRGSGIAGILEDEVCRTIVRRLDDAARIGKDSGRFQATAWPLESVGDSFERRLVRFFQPQNDAPPPVVDARVHEAWRRSQRWRYEALEEAREIGRTRGAFRRSDYMETLGRSLGLQGPIDDISELFRAPGITDADADTIRIICRWMNECYQYNQARSFSVQPTWSTYIPGISDATLAAMEAIDAERTELPESIETVVTAAMPSPRVLLCMNAEELVEIRTQRAGRLYFAALDTWRNSPEDERFMADVNREFQNYASVLRDKCRKQPQYNETLLQQRLARLEGPSRNLAVVASAAAKVLASSIIQPLVPFVSLGRAAYASYIWLTERSRKTEVKLKASLTVNLS